MSDSERIVQIEKYFKLTTRALSIAINLKNPQTLYDIHKGKHGISKDLADRITAKYLNIEKSWLLTGEGEMFKSAPATSTIPKVEYESDPSIKVLIGIIETLTTTNKSLTEANAQMTRQIMDMQRILGEMAENMEAFRRDYQRGDASMGSVDVKAG